MEKSFFELLDGLPLEQKKPFISHFVNTILGKSTNPLMMPLNLTVNNDLDLAAKIKLMVDVYQIDPESMNWVAFFEAEKKVSTSKSMVMEIIKDHYHSNIPGGARSKNDEIIDLGKFLYTTDCAYPFTPGELPDFILNGPRNEIGLEHTRLQNEPDKAYIAEILKKYINPVLKRIITENPALTGLINLTLDMDIPLYDGKSLRNFKESSIKKNASAIEESLTKYIQSVISGNSIPAPPMFKSINFQPGRDAFSIQYNQEYFARTDFENSLIKAVQKKEKRLDAYQSNVALNEWWLLIVCDNTGLSSGFVINENSLNNPLTSKFNRVIILNSFDLSCYEIQEEKPYLKRIAKKQFPAFKALRRS